MKIQPVKAFSDNYIWVIEKDSKAMIIDPGEAEGVLAYLKENELDLAAILLTHNHDDHIGGVVGILEEYLETPIYGPEETSTIADYILQEGDSFEVLSQTFEVIKTAGHTEEHISYLTDDALFCGDALFSGGCGRVFTGNYGAQFAAMKKFKALNDTIKVYAGHEYTETNLRFALSVESENQVIVDALEEVQAIRQQGRPTLPSTIGQEKEINLFMQAESIDKFIELRQARDEF